MGLKISRNRTFGVINKNVWFKSLSAYQKEVRREGSLPNRVQARIKNTKY